LNRFSGYDPAASLEINHRGQPKLCGFRKLWLCPIKQSAGSSTVGRHHFQFQHFMLTAHKN
jgi:hypothetical protein